MSVVRDCPACGRPNSIESKNCMYCRADMGRLVSEDSILELTSAQFEALSSNTIEEWNYLNASLEGRVAELDSGPGMLQRRRTTLSDPPVQDLAGFPLCSALRQGMGPFGPRGVGARVILLPDSSYGKDLTVRKKALHELVALDFYTAGQALVKDTPTFLHADQDRLAAEALAERLREVGLRAVVLGPTAWLVDAEPVVAVSAEVYGPGNVLFRTVDDEDLLVTADELRWGAIGEIRSEGAALAGEEGGDSQALESGLRALALDDISTPQAFTVLDFLRRTVRAPIRVRADAFNFDCLGELKTFSSQINARRLFSLACGGEAEDDPLLPLDDRFKRVAYLPGLGEATPVMSGGRPVFRRELDFTEYVLISDVPNHTVTGYTRAP